MPRREVIEESPAQLADQLYARIGVVRRATRRRTRRDWPYRPLRESEVELLRWVQDRPGIRVQDAAAAMGVAPNTVSTLVGDLVDKGLLVRSVDPSDHRAARLTLSTAAERRIAEWRSRRRALLGEAIGHLTPDDRAALTAALPALGRLGEILGEDR